MQIGNYLYYKHLDTMGKINITESDIEKMVSETVKNIMETTELKKTINRLVAESFASFDGGEVAPDRYTLSDFNPNIEDETKKRDKYADLRKKLRHIKRGKEKNDGKPKKSGRVNKSKRSLVLGWLREPSLDCAEIMRKLWHPEKEEEDSARSYFYKCRDGKLNDSGVPYRFSDEDINALYRIKSEISA